MMLSGLMMIFRAKRSPHYYANSKIQWVPSILDFDVFNIWNIERFFEYFGKLPAD